MAKNEVAEVELAVNEKNIPIWKDENGIVQGLQKSHFLNEEVKASDRKEAEVAFCEYQIAGKKERHQKTMERAQGYLDSIEEYEARIDELKNGVSEETKLTRQKKALEKKMALLEKKLAEMGLDEDVDEEDED